MVLSGMSGNSAKGSFNWFCGKTMLRALYTAVCLSNSLAKATNLDLFEKGVG